MVDTNAGLLAALGIVSVSVGALVWIIKYLFTEIKPALVSLVEVTTTNTAATKSADIYLRERNGRDNEFHSEVMVALQDIPVQANVQAKTVARELKRVGDMTAAKLKVVGSQAIKEQHVEHQHIDHSDRDILIKKGLKPDKRKA